MSFDPDEMMLELFRAEVESHSNSLTGSLLKLEQNPEATNVLDGMMRAAHSIKGAARIVRIDAAVDVAHVMEDCFVAAQRGELVLESNGIDVLLRSVDLLTQIADASKNPNVDWSLFDENVQSTVDHLRSVLNKQPIVTGAPTPKVLSSTKAFEPPSVAVHSSKSVGNSDSTPISTKTVDPIQLDDHSVKLPSSLTAENAEAIRLQLLNLLANKKAAVLDMSDLKDLDAIGLAWLHSAMAYARSNSIDLSVVNASTEMVPIVEWIRSTIRLGS